MGQRVGGLQSWRGGPRAAQAEEEAQLSNENNYRDADGYPEGHEQPKRAVVFEHGLVSLAEAYEEGERGLGARASVYLGAVQHPEERCSGGPESGWRAGVKQTSIVQLNYTNEVDRRVDSVSQGQDQDSYHLVAGDSSLSEYAVAETDELWRALKGHGEKINDQARLINSPLERDESLWMADLYDHVAGYVVMRSSDFQCRSDDELMEKLAGRLSVLPMKDVDHYIVWGKNKTLAVYISAKLAT